MQSADSISPLIDLHQAAALVFLVLGITLCGCTKSTEAFDEVPKISLVSVSATDIVQQQDMLTVTIYYEDGDGDLGSDDPDFNPVRVHDSRLEFPDYYFLPPLAPLDHSIPIQGTLDIDIFPIILLGNGQTETAVFSISIQDRAGNESNTIKTPEITIHRN